MLCVFYHNFKKQVGVGEGEGEKIGLGQVQVMSLKVRWSGSVNHSVVSDFCDCMDYSLPASSVHGILQARTLGLVAIAFSRAFTWPMDQMWVSCITGGWATWDARAGVGVREMDGGGGGGGKANL